MKKIIIILFIGIMPLMGIGQSSLGKTDDMGRIAIAAIVPSESGVPAGAQRILQSKMTQIATQNGLSAVEGVQFAMIPMVSVISQEVTPTAPPMVTLNMEISFYIVDAKSKAIFNQTSVVLKAVGKTEEAAYSQGFKNVNPRQGQFRGFVDKAKEKIIEYYNSQCDVIISSAQTLAGQKKYDEALATLFNVPDVSRECFEKCMGISLDIYQAYSDQMCNEYLSGAKAAWAGKDLITVEENLGKITPDMACYSDAQVLLETITATVEAEGVNSWNFKMKRYDDSVDIQKLKIEAGRDVAKAWTNQNLWANFDWGWFYSGHR